MTKGIFIAGTDTSIGKTVVSAGMMYLLRKMGYHACYYKPILSGMKYDGDRRIPEDTEFVKYISGLEEDNHLISPFCFQAPVSPHLAAYLENKNIDIKTIKNHLNRLANKYDYIVVEGCGGLAVPLNKNYYMQYDLIQELGIPMILVTSSRLGTINHTFLTLKFAEQLRLNVKGIVFNGYEGTCSEDDNIKTIEEITKVPVLATIQRIQNVDTETMQDGLIREVFEKNMDIKKILENMEEIFHE